VFSFSLAEKLVPHPFTEKGLTPLHTDTLYTHLKSHTPLYPPKSRYDCKHCKCELAKAKVFSLRKRERKRERDVRSYLFTVCQGAVAEIDRYNEIERDKREWEKKREIEREWKKEKEWERTTTE
jgi:RNase P subunit RPR2